MARRFYWLKLDGDFFDSKEVKKLRRVAGGDTYTIIYLKMLLKSMQDSGRFYYDGIEETFADEIALEINENPDDVKMTVSFLLHTGLMQEVSESEVNMTRLPEMVGSESDSARRVREHRDRKKLAEPKEEKKATPKTSAERQRAFRAKQNAEKKQHVPLIENHMNQTRYSGNYYIVMQRDHFRCAICGNVENLCVHHIDGYDPEKPENNDESRMITLCRECHSRVHAGQSVPEDLLESIGYGDNVTKKCNTDVTGGNTEKRREEIEKEREGEEMESREEPAALSAPAAAPPVPYEEIRALYHGICSSYPRVVSMSTNRKKAIAARWKEYSYDLEIFRELFERAEASAFMKGKNDRNWRADFDWMLKSDNMAKILEGKYDGQRRKPAAGQTGSGSMSTMEVLAQIAADDRAAVHEEGYTVAE